MHSMHIIYKNMYTIVYIQSTLFFFPEMYTILYI